MREAHGVTRHMAFLVFNDAHFHKDQISSSKDNYNFFKYVDSPRTADAIYKRVMSLCSRVILKDPLGTDKRLIDIFGYTPMDVFKHDYASFVELEELIADIEENHDKMMADKARDLEEMRKEK